MHELSLMKISKKKLHAYHIFCIVSSENDKPGKNLIISVSGFDGRDRQRVKHMIEECGARYTGYLTKHNTTLVCRK